LGSAINASGIFVIQYRVAFHLTPCLVIDWRYAPRCRPNRAPALANLNFGLRGIACLVTGMRRAFVRHASC
jgi:hypothetical protein